MKFCLSPSLRRRPSTLAAWLAVPLLLAGATSPGVESLPGYVVLPLVSLPRSNQAMMRFKVNDQSTMLIVDTGATSIALDKRLYAAAHVRSNDAAPGQLPPEVGRKFKANGSEPAEVGYVDSLKAGGAELGKRPVSVLDLSQAFNGYNSMHQQTAIGGLLGEDVLQDYSAIIDWRRRGVYLNIDRSKRMKLGPGLVASGWTAVPLDATNYRHFTVRCTVGGKPARLVVDTGASYTSFAPGLVPITMMYNRLNDTTSLGHLGSSAGISSMIGGDATMHPGRVEHWKIGDYEIASSVVAVSAMPQWVQGEHSTGDGPVLGFLGCEVLAANNAIIDIGSRVLYLKHSTH